MENLIQPLVYLVSMGFIWWIFYRKYVVIKRQHIDFCKQSQLDRDLSLATTEDLMRELLSRTTGYILIQPVATNSQREQGITISVKGIPPEVAVDCMKFACDVMQHNEPRSFEDEE